MYRIAIDAGGTFTDCVVVDNQNGFIKRYKAPSTPDDYSRGVLDSLQLAADDLNLKIEDFLRMTDLLIHGTTVATNLILSKQGNDVGLIATKGFRDVIEQWWKEERRYDMRWPPPEPPCPRKLRCEVEERIDFSGKVLTPLNEEDVFTTIDFFKKNNIMSIAVSLLFSPINSIHEKKIAEIYKKNFPEAKIHLSHEVLPQLREYERTLATILNAYVAPYSSEYLTRLKDKLHQLGFERNILIMQSNAGVASVETVSKIPIRLALSGPSSGPLAGLFYSRPVKESNIITIDMGGTSFDACLIKNGLIPTATDGYIGRFRLALPSVDVHSLGAGGGSIAWIDPGGILHVGPQSAGAMPGPACYNQGGNEPTVTDANLILGYLNPENFLGGRMKLNKDIAKKVILESISSKIDLNLIDAAQGIVEIVNNNMVDGINEVSVKRGFDPKNFMLLAAGGAGPVHAAKLAQLAGISKIIVPRTASAFCAFGMVISDIRHDYVRPFIYPIRNADLNKINDLFMLMEETGHQTLISEGVKDSDIEFKWSMDMRYIGQIYEVETPIPRETLSQDNIRIIENLFHEKHEMIYGYNDKESDIELVHVRVKAVGKKEKVEIQKTKKSSKLPPEGAIKQSRKVYFHEKGEFIEPPIYDGQLLISGNFIQGPAIIEEPDTTIVVIPDSECLIDEYNNYVLKMKKEV
ncbi:MAG: hydantoinase/oxoprolinase family protein [Promethearchaeota archaeon]|nr:MAG: hydantoinase/oxoprolinase family protein [Candidatus Lokiarchaeota archaeon]